MEIGLKKAMLEIGFDPKQVRENPYDAKIANLRFKKLVKQLDRGHEDFMATMMDDPSVDTEKLRLHFGKNYTEMLNLKKIITNKNIRGEESSQERDEQDRKITLAPIDKFDKKRIMEGKLAYIGIEPRVNTNRPLTKEQKDFLECKKVHDAKQ